MKNIRIAVSLYLIAGLVPAAALNTPAQISTAVYEKIEMLESDGGRIRETDVSIRFGADKLEIVPASQGRAAREFKYSEIRGIEYSYTKNPRWKTGLGLGAATLIFPPMLLIAIPVAFTKHRRHWITIRGEKDFVVLKISKSTRKLFIPTLETYTNVRVEAMGDNK